MSVGWSVSGGQQRTRLEMTQGNGTSNRASEILTPPQDRTMEGFANRGANEAYVSMELRAERLIRELMCHEAEKAKPN